MCYEVPMAARDREDDVLFKDFDEQLSDDSSGLACSIILNDVQNAAGCVVAG